jgi:hypothetical protein
MLNYSSNGRRLLGRPLKRLLDEGKTGLSRPNWWRIVMARIKYKDQIKQEKHCTCNVTLRSVRVKIVRWKSNKCYIFCACVCSLSYPAWKAHAPYYIHLWTYRIFSRFLIKGKIFGKKLLNIIYIYIYWFSLQCLSKLFLIVIRIQRDIIMNVHMPVFM